MSSTNPTFRIPNDPLTPLDPMVKPTPETIRRLQKQLYDNAQAVNSDLGGGRHGHLGMLMPREEYIRISHNNEEYNLPEKPAPPNYAEANQVAIAELKDGYASAKENYKEAQALYNLLKAQLIQAVPEIYISILADPTLGYANVSPQNMLTHLVTRYAKITAKELQANLEHLQAPWDPDTPLDTLFTRGITCRKLAADGKDSITDAAYRLHQDPHQDLPR
jgi:hypothetical protein